MSVHYEKIPASLSNQIQILLLGDDPTKAVDFITDETYLEALKDSSWNIVEIISHHLTLENATGNISLFKTCESLLNIIVEKCKPSETILEILEQMESQENDVKFCALLKPLQHSLKKLKDKSKTFDWCVNTIKCYVDSIPLPDAEISPEEINSELKKTRIINIYNEILFFLKPFIEEASLGNENASDIRKLLLSLLLSLLGKPWCYVSSQLESSEAISEFIVSSICILTGDCFCFLDIIIERDKKNHKLINAASNSPTNVFESTYHVSDLAYANFYYLLITRETLLEKIPQVYDSEYILHNCFHLACNFLQNREQVLVVKGLSLIESVIYRVEKFSLEQWALELPVHSKLFPCLTQVIIYCESNNERKKALEIFRNYVDLFTMQARYQVILQLYKITNHSGLISLINLMVKDSVIKCLEENPPCPYFLGSNLQTLLSFVCRLIHGSTTDLIEIAEEILSALNLLRFLAIRDKENVTGFWNYAKKLEKSYLNNLRNGINLSRSHWKLKVKDLEMEKNSRKTNLAKIENKINNVTITVGKETLSMLPASEKIKFSHQALNALDMMENILIRVNECLEDHRLKLCSYN